MPKPARVSYVIVAGVPVAHIAGAIDASNVDELQTEVLTTVHNHHAGLVMDLSETIYIDSAGVRMLFQLSEQLEWRGQALRITVPPDAPLRRVFTITRLDTLVPVDNTVDQAATALTNSHD